MEYISSFEAKTHLSRLLSEVALGKEYIITRHNKEIAKLTQCDSKEYDVESAIENIKSNRLKVKVGISDILECKAYGRR